MNPNINFPPGGTVERPSLKASRQIGLVSSTIYPWMKGFFRIFDHPYFAVTDEQGRFEIRQAPAGKDRLVVWHPEVGYVQGGKTGIPVTIKADSTTTVEPIKLKPAD
jgi:hypothetical protein